MKKWFMIFAVLSLAIVMVAPAFALDFKATGQYRVRGFHNSNYGLDDNDASDSYFDMRFRLRTDFIVSDNLSLITRFDALDGKKFGDSDNPGNNDKANIDWDRTFMNIKTDYGIFRAGRMGGGTWGTSFNDSEGERDRLRWHNSFGDATLYAIYEKNHEGDAGREFSDQDNDVYYLGATYKMENINMGLLYGFVDYNGTPSETTNYHLFIPFITGQFGPFGLSSELRYNGFGETEYDAAGVDDRDIDQMAFNLEGTFAMDMATFELGYIYVSGQDDTIDGTTTPENGADKNGYAGGIGDDWEKVWILTGSSDSGTAEDLGGLGNLSATGGTTGTYGAHLFYGGATFKPMEDLSVKLMIAYGLTAEDHNTVPKYDAAGNMVGYEENDDDYGIEYDLFVDYKIFDNLTYSFIAAYLDAGDFWEDAGDNGNGIKDLENNFHLYNQLKLSF